MRKEILVIDDSKAIRFMLQTILRKHYKVTSVADGVSAMYCLRKNNLPDLIIINPDLTGFSGLGTCKVSSKQPFIFFNSINGFVKSTRREYKS